MSAHEKFDRAMRTLARERQIEYQPAVAQALLETARQMFAEHNGLKSLPPSDAGRAGALLLAEMPRQEEVDRLLEAIRKDAVEKKLVDDRNDLLIDRPQVIRDAFNDLRRAIGGHPPSFAQRVFYAIEAKREALWVERTKILNWELGDRAPAQINGLLIDTLLSTVAGTPNAAGKPSADDRTALHASLDAPLSKSLLLWQKSYEDVRREMDSELQMPGWGNVWTQPIINRVNMLATGVRTQIGAKIFGPSSKSLAESIDEIQRVSNEVASRLRTITGAVDVNAEQTVGKRYLEIRIDREKAARYGVSMAELSEAIETALGGAEVTQTVEGRQRFPVRLRYARENWQDLEKAGDVLVTARSSPASLLIGGNATATKKETDAPDAPMMQIPLRMVADIRVVEGPSMIKSENGRLRTYVTLNVRDRDIVGFVDEARAAIKPIEASLAGSGMSIEWSGEFEHQLRARQTMMVIFPMVIALIAFLLYMTFHESLDTLLVLLAVAGALAGAVMFQAIFGFNFSVIVSIGYVAAFGMATQTAIIMLVYLRESIDRHGGMRGIASLEELRSAVIKGAVHRLRPKLLTEGVAIVGLVPMLWATGTGAEIMRPMAAPVLGGLLIADEVIDLMIPVLFYWIRRSRWKKLHEANADQSIETPARFDAAVEATATPC
jgi:Cu(I)/Ag(I) efflux system membrane protein CusA/SilA